jgi:DTW domain-containing protein YfiP
VPAIETPSRLLLLVHYTEARKPTNTGLLAARCLIGSRVEIVGDRERPIQQPLVAPGTPTVLLYPSATAVPIAQLASSGATVIVPDGSWRQAAKMGRRVPGLEGIPHVTLDDPRASEYQLRAEPHAHGLATMEAIARAWRILEGEAVEAALLAVFRVMVSRTLWLRGAIGDADVVGGLPAGAHRD